MTTHKQQIQDVYNCLGTVSHLLKESHTGEEIDDFEDNFYSQQMQKASANGSMFPNTLHQVSNFLEKLSVQAYNVQPLLSSAKYEILSNVRNLKSESDGKINRYEHESALGLKKLFNSPISSSTVNHDQPAEQPSDKSTDDSTGYPPWAIEAFNSESNIKNVGPPNFPMGQLGEILIGADPVISPRRQFPPPHYLEQLQRDHPPLFHLNAFDSPPPSPGNELEDYDFNMQIDLNGVIPADVQLLDEFQQENDKTESNNTICQLDLCSSFQYLLKTTTENAQDKQNVLKEILHHSDLVLHHAADQCPFVLKEDMIELSTCIGLIYESLERNTDFESYLKVRSVVQYLVSKVRSALKKYI
ncbi:uncharacterized protein CELE_F34H10.4 [Caenorhabditis elegans]|uniref:Uncharacterized protein F34H10.4 n=1 Tax=Caenorhabditis elegans TaxID=6239 RepID=YQX4_CAEEL|nr:Uncharacterized protein CELE_F34H10.4 [Caenorhabditis elegans]Q09317.2 RecName: Full=Uncharacterized protein F34H10.4 [Caenorhabditis elegans]VTW47565.1 Uncharacterized protein CELE_F34H10.4 [Caenorhabditis elegans]